MHVSKHRLEERAGGKNGVWQPPSKERVVSTGRSGIGEYEQPVLDMEDLVAVGREHKICPFYHSRSLLKDAELIFVPYNYLFDRDAMETTLAEVHFQNAVLIFDEASNLGEFASEFLVRSQQFGCSGVRHGVATRRPPSNTWK